MATKARVTYHSALHPPNDAQPAERFERDGSVAFVYDMAAHGGVLPAEYGDCDVLYTEMAWRPGYRIFQDRAGSEGTTSFAEYLEALSGMVSRMAVPACIVTAPSLVRYMPAPEQSLALRFPDDLHRNGRCVALVYRTTLAPDGDVTTDVLDDLAARYLHVGDPCCGYGNTGRAFVERGGRFTMSDINATCIGWIAENSVRWRWTARSI